MTVHVYQEPGDSFINDVLHGLEIRSVNLPASSPAWPRANASAFCDFPSVWPGYLPWLAPGESIPSPT